MIHLGDIGYHLAAISNYVIIYYIRRRGEEAGGESRRHCYNNILIEDRMEERGGENRSFPPKFSKSQKKFFDASKNLADKNIFVGAVCRRQSRKFRVLITRSRFQFGWRSNIGARMWTGRNSEP